MLYLLGCVGSNAFAIGGSKKGATHLVVGNISRGGGGGSGRRALSRIIHLYNGSDNSSS